MSPNGRECIRFSGSSYSSYYPVQDLSGNANGFQISDSPVNSNGIHTFIEFRFLFEFCSRHREGAEGVLGLPYCLRTELLLLLLRLLLDGEVARRKALQVEVRYGGGGEDGGAADEIGGGCRGAVGGGGR